MASFVPNISKGKVKYYAEKPLTNDDLKLVLLKVYEGDAGAKDRDNLSVLLSNGNTEADFTNYTRKSLVNVTIDVDDTVDEMQIDADDLTYTNAGGASNNSVVKGVIVYDDDTTAGTDTALIPLAIVDVTFTTDGNTLTVTLTDPIKVTD